MTTSKTGYSINYTEKDDTMFSRQGYWASTFTGRRVYIDEPHHEDFCIEDIAHGLSNVCRYGGQCVSFYSVAEHCIRGARNILRETANEFDAYEFLMHDAAEAFVGDQIRPIVMYLDSYRVMRDKMQSVINKKFGLPSVMTPVCKTMDERMLSTEARVMFGHDDKWWESPEFPRPIENEWIATREHTLVGVGNSQPPPTPINDDRQFMNPRQAKREFLALFLTLRVNLLSAGKVSPIQIGR